MRGNTLRRFSAMLLVVVTCSFQPTASLKTQRCVRGGCKLTCPKSPFYNSCEQICTVGNCSSCTGGRCILKCPTNATTCNLRCTVGLCNTVRPTPSSKTTALTVRPTSQPRFRSQTCYPVVGCTCPIRSNYYRCNQLRFGGRCPLTCHASSICYMSFTEGNCKPIMCDSKTCVCPALAEAAP